MKRILLLLTLLIAWNGVLTAQVTADATIQASGVAQQGKGSPYRPITSSVELHLGAASMRNTYLTPLLYSGPDLGIGYERTRRWNNLDWMSLQSINGQFAMGEDRGVHSDQWSGRLRYHYAALYAIDLYYLALMVGPSVGLDLGFDYNLRMGGSNNPATARAAANVGLQFMATMPYRLWGRHSLASLQLQAPMLGYALMPEYGASYYESFYLSNTKSLNHFTSLHNQQDLDVKLTTDIPLRKQRGGALRVGVGYHIETMRINQVTTRFSAFEAIVGWTFQTLPTQFTTNGLLRHEVF